MSKIYVVLMYHPSDCVVESVWATEAEAVLHCNDMFDSLYTNGGMWKKDQWNIYIDAVEFNGSVNEDMLRLHK